VLERFTRLRVALLEAGAGWAPFLVHRLDEHYEKRPGEMPAIRSEMLRIMASFSNISQAARKRLRS
jgi:hypothetical protein